MKRKDSVLALVCLAIIALVFFGFVKNVQILCIGSFMLGIATRSYIMPC
ncbi:unnamed protein product, partial [marine sediment metagenome]